MEERLEGRKCKNSGIKITIWGRSSKAERGRELLRASGEKKHQDLHIL